MRAALRDARRTVGQWDGEGLCRPLSNNANNKSKNKNKKKSEK